MSMKNMGPAEVNYDTVGGFELYSRLFEAEKYFTKSKYVGVVTEARRAFQADDFATCKKKLSELPTNVELLEKLVSKLKRKSVYKTLKQIQEGKIENENSLLIAKGLSSLLTHILIECEQGNTEYRVLLLNTIEKLNEMIYDTLQ